MWLLFALACAPDTPETTTGVPPGTPPGTVVGTPTPTTADCDALPTGPLPFQELQGLYASEDFAFDDAGHLISHFGTSLFKQEYPPGAVTPFAPTGGSGAGPASLRALSNGDVVLANVDTATLARFDSAGARTVVHSGLGYPTGIDILPDDHVVLADIIGVMKIEPYTGATSTILAGGAIQGPNGLTYSVDRTTLYIANGDEIFAMPVDGEGVPTAAPDLFATGPTTGDLLGMGVDACDNLYAVHSNGLLLRWAPTGGDPEVLFDGPPGSWTNLQWGSGIGGWLADHIYITDRTNQVFYEVAVDVESKPY